MIGPYLAQAFANLVGGRDWVGSEDGGLDGQQRSVGAIEALAMGKRQRRRLCRKKSGCG